MRGTNKAGMSFFLFVLCVSLMGCGQENASRVPAEEPEVIVERFYGYISEAKIKGGGSPAREAFKLISAERSHLRVEQFLEVIKKYPPGFRVDVGEVRVNGTQAFVSISYEMPSIFAGGYTMDAKIPLTLDETTNTWTVDFTGETYGMDRDAALEAASTSELEVPQESITEEGMN